MTKNKWYMVGVAVFLGGVLYFLLQPAGTIQAPEKVDRADDTVTTQKTTMSSTATTTPDTNRQKDTDGTSVELEGTFVGLLPAENQFEKKYTYLLLDDGTEVLRIDLRPLIGYSDIDIIEKLGVQRGDVIQVLGTIQDNAFVVETIK